MDDLKAQQTVTFHGSPHHPIEIETLLAKSAADPELPPVFLRPHWVTELRLDARVMVHARSVDQVVAMACEHLAVAAERAAAEAGWKHRVAVDTAHDEPHVGGGRVFRRYIWETAPPTGRIEQLPPDHMPAVAVWKKESGEMSGIREVPLRRAVWRGQLVRAAYDEETNTVFVTP